MNRKPIILLVASLLCAYSASALTRRVPEEYATIQSALNSTNASDTVLVAPGTYHEFLVGPEHTIILQGWYPADTTADFVTLLDPIVTGIDTPSVFVVNGDSTVIRNFMFFNRPEIRQTGTPFRSGGVRCLRNYIRFQNCIFDSVISSVWGGNIVVLDSCQFRGCVSQCVLPSMQASVVAQNCSFESGGFALITAYSNSQFTSCRFLCNTSRIHFLNLFGSNISIDGCKFGPCLAGSPVVSIIDAEIALIQDCQFVGLSGVQRIIDVSSVCSNNIAAPVTVRRCEFRGYHPIPPAQGGTAITSSCSQGTLGLSMQIENCVFVDGEIEGAYAPGVQTSSNVEILGCIFDSLSPNTAPDVYAIRPWQDSVYARNNSFLPPGLAARTAGSYFDARENWWGDSTGPYNINENPEGQGSEVANGVLFVPWLTHPPDTTTDTTHISIDEPADIQLSTISLATFPNPFNSTVTIEYALTHEQNVTLAIYDLLGRQVETLLDERQGIGVHKIKWNADHFASGLYFARLSSPRGPAQAVKLLLMK